MARPHDGSGSDAVVVQTATVSFENVLEAAARLRDVAHRTPVLTSRALDAQVGARVFLKCENFQRVGAFKFRGAYNRLAQLDSAQRARGVVTFSSGNHGQGIALAAKLLDVQATIVMPSDAPASKLDAIRGYGAQIVLYTRAEGDREAIARKLARERGAVLVPPYDDARIIAGQGTAALELLQEVGVLDALVVPTGGGGLLSGSAIAAHGFNASIELYGVEPEAGNDFAQSLEAGLRVSIPVPDTIADGMQTQSPGELTFEMAKEHSCRVVTVTDDQLKSAMRFAFERLKIVVEPSGAAALAALLAGKIKRGYARIGAIISGGNIDAARFASLLST